MSPPFEAVSSSNRSSPSPPFSMSAPPLPRKISSPASPFRVSAAVSPISVSLPAPPLKVMATPGAAVMVSAALPPVTTSTSLLMSSPSPLNPSSLEPAPTVTVIAAVRAVYETVSMSAPP